MKSDIRSVEFAAQGDVMFRRIEVLPAEAVPRPIEPPPTRSRSQARSRRKARVVVAHSETGHDHAVLGVGLEFFVHRTDPLTCFLRLEHGGTVEHARAIDNHAAFHLAPGLYEVRRQREYTPQGLRRVDD